MAFENGPYIAAALLCEKVLTESDGAQSAIRIVDRIIATVLTAAPAGVELPPPGPVQVDLWALLLLKNGDAEGSHHLDVVPLAPSGIKMQSTGADLLFEGGPDRGVSLTFPVKFAAQEEGLYWLDVSLDGTLLTRMPLRIIIQRLAQTLRPGY